MKYNTTLPDDTVNISETKPLATFLKLSLSLIIISGALYWVVGSVMNYAIDHVTPEQEIRLTEFLAADLNTSSATPYLKQVTQKMAQCAALPYPVTVAVMEEKDVNAFAAPGGRIYLTQGLLKKLDDENELAFIIGHELGHFKHKDQLRALGYKVIFWLINAILGTNYGFAVSSTLSISSAHYSQAAELAADAFGLETMHCAYGSVTHATTLFAKMDDGHEWRYFTATHPAFKERIEKMNEQIIREAYDTVKKPLPLGKL